MLKNGEVSRFEYLQSDNAGAALTFKRTGVDTLVSACGRYQVVRWSIGHGDFVFDANAVSAEGVVTCIAFEGSSGAAKRACELEAGRVARAEVRTAA